MTKILLVFVLFLAFSLNSYAYEYYKYEQIEDRRISSPALRIILMRFLLKPSGSSDSNVGKIKDEHQSQECTGCHS